MTWGLTYQTYPAQPLNDAYSTSDCQPITSFTICSQDHLPTLIGSSCEGEDLF
jgi:hypothetical protein